MNANGEARKRGGGMTRTFSPLTPIIQHLYSKSHEVRDTVQVAMVMCCDIVFVCSELNRINNALQEDKKTLLNK